jgi:hypothetical protein
MRNMPYPLSKKSNTRLMEPAHTKAIGYSDNYVMLRAIQLRVATGKALFFEILGDSSK